MNPSHLLGRLSRAIHPQRAKPLAVPPATEDPAVASRPFHTALLAKWRVKFDSDQRRQKPVS